LPPALNDCHECDGIHPGNVTGRGKRRMAGRDATGGAQRASLAKMCFTKRHLGRAVQHTLLHHSDRGSQYTSEQFQQLMADLGTTCSMSRSGNRWDNAAMESFFASLKTERTANKTYRKRNDAKTDVFDYIERFYNPKRRHSTIGYLSPMDFEIKAGLA
jgi:transposase InsO family protein